jgi:type IX secretion system PorP/SprF family membrane protein
VILVLIVVLSNAQDIHFSQYENSPLIVNPALTGSIQGKCRFIVNYRNQWRSITKNSFRTYAFSSDFSFSKEKLSAGLCVFKDVAGKADMSLSQINLSAASKIRISNNNFFKLGIQTSWSQRHIDPYKLTWNSQYDGTIINPDLNSGGNNFQESFSYLDIATGILWTHKLENKTMLNVGLSAFHVNKPQSVFLSDIKTLDIRWCGHADMSFILSPDKLMVYPSVLIMHEGSSNEIDMRAIIKSDIGNNSKYTGIAKSSSVLFGVFYRWNDAIIVYVELDYRNQLDLCFSYDINVSRLIDASHARGGAELSLIYVIPEKQLIKLK